MSFRADQLLKHLPLEIQYQEIKTLEEASRKARLAQARGRAFCCGLSLLMASSILHPSVNQWVEGKLQLNRIAGISISTASNKPKQADKIAAALVDYARKNNWEVRTRRASLQHFLCPRYVS